MKSVREITTYKWIIKKSEFICTLIPCNDETAIDNIIKEYQEKYHDATHNCIAYIVGTQKRANDNGEQSGTAGLPMLEVLLQLMNLVFYIKKEKKDLFLISVLYVILLILIICKEHLLML